MKIVIIGAGNVATVLGWKLQEAGHAVVGVGSRQDSFVGIDPGADCYILAVSDDAIRGVGGKLSLAGKLVVHTAGSVPMDALASISERYGVFYPLQSLRKEIRPFPAIPMLIDASNEKDLATIESLARSITSQVQQADDRTRLKLHLGAIFVNNFTNFLYTQAAQFCRQENMDFNLLLPLIAETTQRLQHARPEQVQTGPAVRGDRSTIEKHLELLTDHKDMQDMYRWFTTQIMHYYNVPENRPAL